MIKDTCVTIVPYFRIHENKIELFKKIAKRFIERTSAEYGVVYYGFSFSNNIAHCREGYLDAGAVLVHLENVADLLNEVADISELMQLEIHGPESELEKLLEPLERYKPAYFKLEMGFRK